VFLKYKVSDTATAATEYTITASIPAVFENVQVRMLNDDDAICPTNQFGAQSITFAWGSGSFTSDSRDISTCDSVGYIYFAVTPFQPQNRVDNVTQNVTIKVEEFTPPASKSIALGTTYNITRESYFTLPESSVPSGQFLV